MKVIVGIIILSALLTAGCESGEVKKAKETVAHKLKDPASAQFRMITEGKALNGLNAVCGEVNGKNAFGAYSGYRRFITNNSGSTVYIESQWPEEFEMLWLMACPN